MTKNRILDLTTTDGLVEHLNSLPTENLRAIEARPVWNGESARITYIAACILARRDFDTARPAEAVAR